jgi:hypothetical protein
MHCGGQRAGAAADETPDAKPARPLSHPFQHVVNPVPDPMEEGKPTDLSAPAIAPMPAAMVKEVAQIAQLRRPKASRISICLKICAARPLQTPVPALGL